jgi:hypothetical protein
VKHTYIFEHEQFRMVCEHVFDSDELVEVCKTQTGDIFGAMQKDKQLAMAVIDWANDLVELETEEGFND